MKDITSPQWLKQYYDSTDLKVLFDPSVLTVARLYDCANGEEICTYGENLTALLFLVEGAVKIFNMVENGRTYLLRIERPFQIFGEAEILRDGRCIANVEALPGCRIIGVPVWYIEKHYLNNPAFLRFIITSLSGRLDRISRMSTANLLLPLKNKVASFIMAHMVDDKNAELPNSYASMAEQMGCTYRHLSRTLKDFEEEGLIRRQNKGIQVVNMKDLEAMAKTAYRYKDAGPNPKE